MGNIILYCILLARHMYLLTEMERVCILDMCMSILTIFMYSGVVQKYSLFGTWFCWISKILSDV